MKNVVLALLMVLALAPAQAAEPDFGSGAFGQWTTDEYGLPAYRYTMRHDDPAARWDPKTEPVTNLMWHQLGNDRVTASAYNLGFVKLFYDESGAMWLNEYQPDQGEHAGGFGWTLDGDTVLIDRDELIPPGTFWERTFGMGYFQKRLDVPGLQIKRDIFAPTHPQDIAPYLPVLVSEITLRNTSDHDKKITLIEYWDVNSRLLTDVMMGRGFSRFLRDDRVRMKVLPVGGGLLLADTKKFFGPSGGYPPQPTLVDPELPSVFLWSPDLEPDAWITDPADLFNGPEINTDPARLKTAGAAAPDPAPRSQHQACLAARFTLDLPAGAERTLHFEFGYNKGGDLAQLEDWVAEGAREDSRLVPSPEVERTAPSTMLDWLQTMPRLTLPGDEFMGRELAWDYYYFTSASLYDAYYDSAKVPQGANYLYYSGMDGATRDYAAFVQTASYYRPELARQILTFMMRCQDQNGRMFYDLGGFGTRYNNPYRPGDLDIWFLWALAEYVFATRDFAFLDQPVIFYPRETALEAPVWEHARRSFDHLINVVGEGPHGHPKLRLSDWNDEMMWLTAGKNPLDMIMTFQRGESVMNTAMACVMLPMLADLADGHGDAETAAAARAHLATMRAALDSAWTGDHLVRAYSGLGKPFGDHEMYLEPQAWALLDPDALSPERQQILIEKIERELQQPSKLGMMISTSTSGSATTRPGEQEEGGIWFAINGPAAVALAAFDHNLAWDQIKRNTLAWHADVYPQTWYGIWSGPDAWNSTFSDRPAETWYMKTPIINTGPQMYPIQNAHAHCQTLWAVARVAGLTPTAAGWTLEPRIPMEEYSFDCALYGLDVSPQKISGRVNLDLDQPLTIKLRPPEAWRGRNVKVQVMGADADADATREGDYIVFTIPAGFEPPVEWIIYK